jgi:CYTH domain-containing protein
VWYDISVKYKQKERKIQLYVAVCAVLAILMGVIFTAVFYKVTKPDLLPTQITGGKEIERKWLLDSQNIPVDLEREAVGVWRIEQTYINFSPEVRVRKIVDEESQTSFILTVKSDLSVDGLTRNEKEWYISEEEYGHLLGKSEGETIYKTRYRVDRGGLHYEYDIFHEQLEGLAYLEIEFVDEGEAWDFVGPDYVIKDVTSDRRYKNQGLAQDGIPED